MKKCMTCFQENPDTADKCSGCGANLNAYLAVKNVAKQEVPGSSRQSFFLPTVLKIIGILTMLGGYIGCSELWPKGTTTEGIAAGIPQTALHPELVTAALGALVGGLIAGFLLWALGEVVRCLKVIAAGR